MSRKEMMTLDLVLLPRKRNHLPEIMGLEDVRGTITGEQDYGGYIYQVTLSTSITLRVPLANLSQYLTKHSFKSLNREEPPTRKPFTNSRSNFLSISTEKIVRFKAMNPESDSRRAPGMDGDNLKMNEANAQ